MASLANYVEACARHGRPIGVTAIRRDIYVGESAAEADATGGALIRAGYRGFAPDATIVGDVEQVTAAFGELAQMGYTDVIIRNLVADQAKALACIARLAEVKQQLSGDLQ
jgi:hypothetical protein